jgi:hypothetical protein
VTPCATRNEKNGRPGPRRRDRNERAGAAPARPARIDRLRARRDPGQDRSAFAKVGGEGQGVGLIAGEEALLEDLRHAVRRLERLLAIGFAEQIEAERERHDLNDQVSDAILMRTAGWTPAGRLKAEVETASAQSSMTVKRRLNRLVQLGALERRGKATSTEYRSTGLLG